MEKIDPACAYRILQPLQGNHNPPRAHLPNIVTAQTETPPQRKHGHPTSHRLPHSDFIATFMLRKNIVLAHIPLANDPPVIGTLARPPVRRWSHTARPLLRPPAQSLQGNSAQTPHPDGQCVSKSCSHIGVQAMSLALTTGSGAKDIMPCATPSPRGGFQVGPRAVCVNPLATWAPRCSGPPPTCRNMKQDWQTHRGRHCPLATHALPEDLSHPDLQQIAHASAPPSNCTGLACPGHQVQHTVNGRGSKGTTNPRPSSRTHGQRVCLSLRHNPCPQSACIAGALGPLRVGQLTICPLTQYERIGKSRC